MAGGLEPGLHARQGASIGSAIERHPHLEAGERGIGERSSRRDHDDHLVGRLGDDASHATDERLAVHEEQALVHAHSTARPAGEDDP